MSSRPAVSRRFSIRELSGRIRPKSVIIAGVVLVIGYLTLIPLAFLLSESLFEDGRATLSIITRAYRAAGLSDMLLNSAVFALGSTAVSVGLGTTLAYLAVRTDLPFRRAMFGVALIPLIIPGILHTVSWIFLTNPRIGLLNNLLGLLPGSPTFDIFSLSGMVLVEGLHQTPLIFLLMAAAFRAMDPSLEESALMSGARLTTVIRRVTLPLARPALLGAVVVSIVSSLEAFEVPALLGIPRGVWVFTSRIWQALDGFPADFGAAGAYALTLLAITTLLVFLHGRLSRRGERFQTVTGRAYRPRLMPLGRLRRPAAVFVGVYVAIGIVFPLLILLYVSTQRFYTVPSFDALSSATLDNYRYVFTHPQVVRALRNSLVLAIGSGTTVMMITAIASWLVVKTSWRGRWLVDGLASMPMVLPGLVVGVSLLFVYLRAPIPIYGTLWILFIAYLTRYMPYGMRYASTSMYQISDELEESARMSGASWWQTFRRINMPLIVPGLVAGWSYILIVSVRELSSSILLYSPGNEVLSVVIWEQWENGQFTELAALGVLMIGLLILLATGAARFGARFGIREST